MRKAWIAAFIVALMPLATPSQAAVSVSIGIDIPTYPALVPVPGVPVYYAPSVNANYFFYDGMYWNFDGNQWYGSTWYNGPWAPVAAAAVPVYLWRIPVRYYRVPPPYFHGWVGNSPPHWGEHWGAGWVNDHHGWDHWDHHAVPARAPLPVYQRGYAGDHYPRAEEQVRIHNQSYHYAPREATARAHYEEHGYHPVAAQQAHVNHQQQQVNREQAHVNREQQQVHHEQQQVHHEQQQVHHEQQHVEKEQHKEKDEHDHH